VSADPSPKAIPKEAVWFLLIYMLVWATYLTGTGLWLLLWPSNPWWGVMLLWVTFALGPAVALPGVMLCLPRQWFRVPMGERALHRIAGVGIFGWLLDVSGWNRRVAEPWRRFSGKRAGLPSLELTARAGVVYHGICFAIHLLLAVLALFSRHPWSGALWMLLPGVVVHLYPVLLQRSIMLRLQPLLDKTGSC
jgi:hypothetical protein